MSDDFINVTDGKDSATSQRRNVFKFYSEIYELPTHFKDDAITYFKPLLFVTSLAIRVLIVMTIHPSPI